MQNDSTKAQRKKDALQFLCSDCKHDVNAMDEYYMVHNRVWAEAGAPRMLCIGCLEVRLGRQLTADDFTGSIVNFNRYHSPRLKERRKGLVLDPQPNLTASHVKYFSTLYEMDTLP